MPAPDLGRFGSGCLDFRYRITGIGNFAGALLREISSPVGGNRPMQPKTDPTLPPGFLVSIAKSVCHCAAGQHSGYKSPHLLVCNDGAGREGVHLTFRNFDPHGVLNHLARAQGFPASLYT
jgi:hypothetical protein